MHEVEYRIRSDGKVDVSCGMVDVVGIFPYIDGKPVVFRSVEAMDDSVRYCAEQGTITLSFRHEKDEMVLSTELDGFDGVHDVEPIGEAVLAYASHVYVQGFGMEGPSGYHLIDQNGRDSHGMIALCGTHETAVVYARDHRRFRLQFSVRERDFLFSREKVFSAGVNLEGTTSGIVSLPDLYFKTGDSLSECLRYAAGRIADFMEARTCLPPAYYWCSWYYHYENFSQERLEEFLEELREEPAHFRYIQIDAGYTGHIGDWMETNHRYPEGLLKAAASIREAGYQAGIWIAPFLAGDCSTLYRDHPDWVIRDLEGRPYVVFRSYTEPKIWGNTDSDYYILDATHPEAFAYLREVFQMLAEGGFTLFKTDFMLWGMVDSSKVRRYEQGLTSIEIFRKVLAMIREVIGEDSFWLGSIAPFLPFVGYADGMRIAGDVGAQWAVPYGPVNLLQELPVDNYFNHIFWQNDPDSVILRNFETKLTAEETRSLALLQALSGGVITTSDPVTRLSEERKKLLQLIRPGKKVHAEFLNLTEETEEISIIHRLDDWNLLFVLNPTEHPLRVCFKLDELFGEKTWYLYRYDWNDGTEAVSEKSTLFLDWLMPHDSVLLFVTETPMTEKPSNLWNR